MVAIYEEQREEKFDRDGMEVTRTLRVEPYEARQEVIATLIGGPRLVGGLLVRVPPARDPWYPWCFVVDVKCVPFEQLASPGSAAGLVMLATRNYSESARLVVTYRTLDREETSEANSGQAGSEDDEKELASESWDFRGESIKLASDFWKWSDGELLSRTLEDFGVTKHLTHTEYTLRRFRCINIPQVAIASLQNRVNAVEFKFKKKRTVAAECVRFEGAQIQHRVSNVGVLFADITYSFMVRRFEDYVDGPGPGTLPVTWNRIYRPEKGWWERPILASGIAKPIYHLDSEITQEINGETVTGFNLLFHPGAR
jgi:hypothetical protein